MQTTNNYQALAAAILRGAAYRPQATNGEYYEEPMSITEPFASCSLGAAYEATHGPYEAWGVLPAWVEQDDLRGDFPCLDKQAPVCPDLACVWSDADSVYLFFDPRDRLLDLINHLNDEHKWSREAIAVFVAGLEVQHAEP